MKLSFKLNGKDQNLDIDGEMPLLWVLRDVVKLKGTKFGCGKGLCGACTVHLDNAAIRSCVTPVQFAQGKSVTTIEGLSETNTHPLQKAWLNRSVPQCGYCQPGQIMQAASLLSNNGNPDSNQIEETMSGNLCRCGTYMRIRQAIQDAAKEIEEA